MHQYKLYENKKYIDTYEERELAKKFNISVSTLRFCVTNGIALSEDFTAEITADKVLLEKTKPTDPQMIKLLQEWEKVRKMFLR